MKRNSQLTLATITSTVFLASLLLSQGGCSSLERSRASGYADRSYDLGEGRDRRAMERDAVMNQMGFDGRRELSDREEQVLENRIALTKAEKSLEGKREREQYFKNKPYMKSDAERMDFLALDSFEKRGRWLNSKGITSTSNHYTPEHQYLVDTNDITLGMTKQAVRDSWGEPELVEVAGNPLYGNERWHYSEQTSSTEGYQSQRRMVYFDAGRVSGWESR